MDLSNYPHRPSQAALNLKSQQELLNAFRRGEVASSRSNQPTALILLILKPGWLIEVESSLAMLMGLKKPLMQMSTPALCQASFSEYPHNYPVSNIIGELGQIGWAPARLLWMQPVCSCANDFPMAILLTGQKKEVFFFIADNKLWCLFSHFGIIYWKQ